MGKTETTRSLTIDTKNARASRTLQVNFNSIQTSKRARVSTRRNRGARAKPSSRTASQLWQNLIELIAREQSSNETFPLSSPLDARAILKNKSIRKTPQPTARRACGRARYNDLRFCSRIKRKRRNDRPAPPMGEESGRRPSVEAKTADVCGLQQALVGGQMGYCSISTWELLGIGAGRLDTTPLRVEPG